MAECRAALEAAGFEEVETHLQTGNVRVRTPMRTRAKVEAAMEKVFEQDRGFAVETLCLKPGELRMIVANADEVASAYGVPGHGQYVELLREAPDKEVVELIEAQTADGQRFVVRERAIHLLLDKGFHELKAPNAATKRAMGVSTNRNLNVLRTLSQKWG